MKVELFPFQKTALANLRMSTATALGNYQSTHTAQVVSYTAPTGAGKTIIMAALIEAIYFGDEMFPDQSDAIFVWLSDSPQLNEQSKLKIDTKADKIGCNQCITISDDSFDMEMLEDGHIYFLNTQKLGKNSNLTHLYDGRQHTIWETLANTARNKSDRLYFIIDEAHRGAKSGKGLAEATTIMQKFLKGSEADGLPVMPVVIGMSATAKRFNRLAEDILSTVHKVVTTPDEVRSSGLLKDRIVITYPEKTGNEMAVLQTATDEWKDKWDHWYQYCNEQHYAYVNPIFVIQVENESGGKISATDLDECVRCIEERSGERFTEGEVVHAFGETKGTLQINGLNVPYVEPSRIADDKRIKVVFFKETLSTGWDCPRAETMMSFRHAKDHTYIAQLLGRMVRTPMQMHINVDDTLNDVHLYVPQFDSTTVYEVVDALQSAEGANIPTDIESEQIDSNTFETWGLNPTYKTPVQTAGKRDASVTGQISIDELANGDATDEPEMPESTQASGKESQDAGEIPEVTAETPDVAEPAVVQPAETPAQQTQTGGNGSVPTQPQTPVPAMPKPPVATIDREAVVKAINDAGLLTYDVRTVQITNYIKSMFALSRLLTQTRIDIDAKDNIMGEIVDMIHTHIESLKASNQYDSLVDQVLEFKLSTQIFDVFGKTVDNYEIHDMLSTSDLDIDRQFRLAETRLGNEGVGNKYVQNYYSTADVISLKIDVIIFAADADCMDALNTYAKKKFHELNDDNRRKTVMLPDKFKKKYDDIVSDGDIVSKHNFRLPEAITVRHEPEGKPYSDHLFVGDSGYAFIKLNGWEEKVIEEEEKRDDFVCWLRNPSRGSWALRIPYEIDGVKKPAYPDFLIVRKDGPDYVVDILEPHDPTRIDNLGKAKGFAEYARQNPGVGRIQLIRMKKDSVGQEKAYRLDMSKSSIRDSVFHCASIDELNHVFENDGFFE